MAKPKSAKLKAGTQRKDRGNPQEPVPDTSPGAIGEPCRKLTRGQRAEFDLIAKHLHPNTSSRQDNYALCAVAVQADQYFNGAAEGRTASMFNSLLAALAKFGITPSDRRKVVQERTAAQQEAGFRRFIDADKQNSSTAAH